MYHVYTEGGHRVDVEPDALETKLVPSEVTAVHLLLAAMDDKGYASLPCVGMVYPSSIPGQRGELSFDLSFRWSK